MVAWSVSVIEVKFEWLFYDLFCSISLSSFYLMTVVDGYFGFLRQGIGNHGNYFGMNLYFLFWIFVLMICSDYLIISCWCCGWRHLTSYCFIYGLISFFSFARYHLDVSWTFIIVRGYVESICLSKRSSGYWIIYFEFRRCFILFQSFWCLVCWLTHTLLLLFVDWNS